MIADSRGDMWVTGSVGFDSGCEIERALRLDLEHIEAMVCAIAVNDDSPLSESFNNM